MKHCYECGTSLIDRPLDGEGNVPFCENCGQYRFPIFSTAISTEILTPDRSKVLLIQQYGRKRNILVAGYVNQGESAEEALIREVREEVGLNVTQLHYVKSEFFKPSNTLMINYCSIVDSENLDRVNYNELDSASWYSLDEAKNQIAHETLAERFFLRFLDIHENILPL